MGASEDTRPGELAVAAGTIEAAAGARVIFIGRIRSSWPDRDSAPRNLRQARELGAPGRVEIEPPFRPGLDGIGRYSHLVLLYWLDRSRRDLVIQKPRHAEAPRGVFALRSPVRPNPIGLAVVRLLSLDIGAGVLEIDAIDCIDGTPLLDIKPYLPSTDAFPDAMT